MLTRREKKWSSSVGQRLLLSSSFRIASTSPLMRFISHPRAQFIVQRFAEWEKCATNGHWRARRGRSLPLIVLIWRSDAAHIVGVERSSLHSFSLRKLLSRDQSGKCGIPNLGTVIVADKLALALDFKVLGPTQPTETGAPQLEGWWIAAPSARYTVLYMHGQNSQHQRHAG